MGLYFGISCLRLEWNGIYLNTEKDSTLHDFACVELDDDSPSLFSSIEPLARLDKCETWFDAKLRKSMREEIINLDISEKYSRHIFDVGGTPNAVGICHPYGTSPPARRALPAVVSLDPISLESRTERDSERGEKRVCAIETPFAACLSLIDSKAMSLPATLVVVGPAPATLVVDGLVADGVEATVVRVAAQRTSLKMDAVFHCNLSESTSDDLQKVAAVVQDRSPKFAKSATKLIVSVGDETTQTANALSNAIPDASLREIDERELAAGAARYASLCVDENHGFDFTTLDCTQVAEHPIGICGRNEDDEFFWCPITQPGHTLGETSTISIDGELPLKRVVLAEFTKRDVEPQAWATADDAQYLRWHSQVAVQQSNAPAKSLKVSIECSTGCLKYGWSDPYVKAELSESS
jgi:hypothetical protein